MSFVLAVALAQASLPFDMLPLGASPTEQIDPCPYFEQAKPPGTTRPVTSSDLVELADIGRWDPSDPISPFGISPDGKQIAFILRRANPAANGYCQRLMVMPLDATKAPVERDRGGSLIRESYLFDERFAPDMGDQPLPTRSHPLELTRWNIGDGTKRTAEPDEVSLITPTRPRVVPSEARMFTEGPKGVAAWTQAVDPSKVLSPVELVLVDGTGRRISCDERLCTRVAQIWWADDGHTLFGVVRGGWARSRTSVIAWQVGQKAPRVIPAVRQVERPSAPKKASRQLCAWTRAEPIRSSQTWLAR